MHAFSSQCYRRPYSAPCQLPSVLYQRAPAMTVVDTVSGTADSLLSSLNSYAASHHDGVVALMLCVGLIVSFCGRSLLGPTVFLLGFIPTFAVFTALGFAFAEEISSENLSWLQGLSVLLSVIVAVLVGIVMLRLLFNIATFVLCAGFGAVMVFVAHLFLLEPAAGNPSGEFLLYAAAVVAALASGLLSLVYPEMSIILGTSFDGAAVAIYCLARFLGHRPDVFGNAAPATPDVASVWWAIAYGSATLILGLGGAVMQRRVALADGLIARAAADRAQAHAASADDNDGYTAIPDEALDGSLGSDGGRDGHHAYSAFARPRKGGPDAQAREGYGSVDDSVYSVVHNLGAAPLSSVRESVDNGPLSL